jgi:hypothetical protein
MKKLEDIPKQDIFKIPDGYFDTLPSIIQARVAKKESTWSLAFRYSVKYALPTLIVTLGLVWFLNGGEQPVSTEQLIASIHTEDLVDYIQDADLSTEDLLESIDYTMIDADSLDLNESNILPADDDLTDISNEFEFETEL